MTITICHVSGKHNAKVGKSPPTYINGELENCAYLELKWEVVDEEICKPEGGQYGERRDGVSH